MPPGGVSKRDLFVYYFFKIRTNIYYKYAFSFPVFPKISKTQRVSLTQLYKVTKKGGVIDPTFHVCHAVDAISKYFL